MDQEIKDAFESIAKVMDAQKEARQLALICAQDIVEAWPTLTMRTLGSMTKRMETLKQALEAAK
jgi:hypothetical protein